MWGKVVYYNDGGQAGTPKVHFWGGTSPTSPEWDSDPEMANISGDIYAYDIGDHTHCKFRYNNASESTADLDVPSDAKNYYNSGWLELNSYAVGKNLYLKVNSNWKEGSARFAACFCGVAGQTWVNCSQVGSSDYYSVTVPEGEWPMVIFCRMKNGSDEERVNKWGNMWDQTDDLFYEYDKNLCSITAEGWSHAQTRGQYAPNGAIHGSMNSWVMMSFNSFNGDGELKLELGANTAYEFQVISDESWYGYGDANFKHTLVGQTAKTTLSTGDKDILILTADAGEYTFKWDKSSHELSVTYPNLPNSTNLNPNYVYVINTSNWSPVNAHLWGGYNRTVWDNDPALSTVTFNSTTYYYAATGYESSIIFGQGVNNSYKTGDLTISDGKGKYYDPSSSSWKWFSSRITLNNQSATSAGTEYKDAELFNTALTTKISCPGKTGYIFGGYYTASDGGGVQIIEDDGDWIASVSGYTNASTQWVRASTELFAKWTSNTTTVTLNANGGDSNSEVVATYDASLPAFDGITRTGHLLTGYWTSATGGTLVINANGTYVENSGLWNRTDGATLTLFAQWISLTTPTVTAAEYYIGEPETISLSATSTGLANPVVIFYVNDGTTTYEVTGAPYGSDGNSVGAIGAVGTEYSTVHKATFIANAAGTYTVTAKLYEGKFIDNFDAEGLGIYWNGIGYGTCERVTNIERETINGSNKVLKITRSTTEGELGESHTAWTTTTAEGGTRTGWGLAYNYIHMRYYAPQTETPKVQYIDNNPEGTYKNTTLSEVVANTWHNLAFTVDGGTVDLIYPFITSGDGHSIYIDDIILSNESFMTAKITTENADVTIRRPFIIYRTGDKEGDARAEDGDVESYEGGTIDRLIEYRMRVRACDQWYTLCLPFDVQAVQVWDAEDGKYYDIVPYYRSEDKFYNGHYIIRYPNKTTDFELSDFDNWKDPSSPTDYVPAKNTPYIIQWHDPYFSNRYVSFFGATGQTIPTDFSAGSAPSSDNVVNVCTNNTMHTGSVAGAYLLEGDYGGGAWLRLDNASASRAIPPFECYLLANSATRALYKAIQRGMVPTAIEAVCSQPSEVRKVMINGKLFIIRDNKMYNVMGMEVQK